MYGLLVENLASFVRIQWGESKWDMVRKGAGIDAPSFSIHHVYPETLLNKLAKSAFEVLGVDDKNFFEAMGIYFVEFVGQYGYDAMLTVLGRHMRDFLNGLDNLHEYLKFSYTKMRAPSFYCDSETANGLRLHYRSRRRGFVYYVMGQIKQVAKHFYNQDCGIEILSESLDGETMHTIFQLTFDNNAFSEAESLKSMIRQEQQLPIRASIIFELFPFCIVFTPEMTIKFTGHALLTILKDLVGQVMTEAFEIVKPLISFCFSVILERRNNIFELITSAPIKDDEALTGSFDNESEEETGTSLRLRGQMLHMEEWNMMLFLANPVMPDLDSLVQAGLFINDLSLHDCSRDLVLAGTQQSVELKLALDQEQHKSKKLEESMKKLDDEMRKTDEMLYQMIPKQVADRLRSGDNAVDTCETFETVTILFSDVVTFTDICSRITPMQVVCMLNHMYSLFDQLTERNGVYKVETIGDSYMVVCGAPLLEENHAERVCDMALDMVDAMQAIEDPSREGEHLKIRVGCHSGSVVAGVVGVKMPRYCLFGDAVNTASRMESTSEGGKIQISVACKDRLPPPYLTERRGTVTVKGKGEMETYFLMGRKSRVPLNKTNSKSFNWTAPVPTVGATSVKQPQTMQQQMAKQFSTASAASEQAATDAAALVKAEAEKNDTSIQKKKFVRQQSAVKLSNLAPMNLTNKSFNKNEPPLPDPVDIRGGPVVVNATIVKPEVESPSAFAARQASEISRSSNIIPVVNVQSSEERSILQQIEAARQSPYSQTMPTIPDSVSQITRSRSASPNPEFVLGKEDNSKFLNLQPYNDNTDNNPPNLNDISRIRRRSSADIRPLDQTNTAFVPVQTVVVNSTVAPVQNQQTASEETESSKLIKLSLPNGIENTTFQITTENISPAPINDVNQDETSEGNEGRGRRKSVFIEGINGIRKGSRDFRNKIRDKKLTTVTVEAMTDVGCSEFAVKQKEIISQACILL